MRRWLFHSQGAEEVVGFVSNRLFRNSTFALFTHLLDPLSLNVRYERAQARVRRETGDYRQGKLRDKLVDGCGKRRRRTIGQTLDDSTHSHREDCCDPALCATIQSVYDDEGKI